MTKRKPPIRTASCKVSKKELNESLCHHGIGNFNKATDIGAFYIVDETIGFRAVFHAILVNIDHDIVETGINLFPGP